MWVVNIFATDLGQLGTAESENNIRFSLSGQVFMLSRLKKLDFITFSVDFS